MKHFLGIADDEFIRGKVPMTKQEIRILTMAKARIGAEDIVYDIGAGTGSLSIEAALQAENGHVYAIERKAEGIALIQQNAEKFGVRNLTVVQHEAPEGMDELPACDVVLIGGSGSILRPVSLTNNQPSLMNGGKDFCDWSKKDELLYATMRRPVETVLGRDGVGLADCAICGLSRKDF